MERLGLASESVVVDKDRNALTRRLRINGATDDEIEFLLSGRRVELNAMTSDAFVRFVEDGLMAHGVTKVVPVDGDARSRRYAAYRRGALAEQALEAELAQLNAEPVDDRRPTSSTGCAIALAAHPDETWDFAIRVIVEEDEINTRKGDRS